MTYTAKDKFENDVYDQSAQLSHFGVAPSYSHTA